MIASFLLLAAGLQELPPQRLAPGACALVLWEQSSRQRVAMVVRSGNDAPSLRLRIDDADTSLSQQPDTTAGEPVLGFAPEARFSSATLSASHRLDLTAGGGRAGAVRSGVLSVRLVDGAELVVPVAGVIGCG